MTTLPSYGTYYEEESHPQYSVYGVKVGQPVIRNKMLEPGNFLSSECVIKPTVRSARFPRNERSGTLPT